MKGVLTMLVVLIPVFMTKAVDFDMSKSIVNKEINEKVYWFFGLSFLLLLVVFINIWYS